MRAAVPIVLLLVTVAACTNRQTGEPDRKGASASPAGETLFRLLPEPSDVRPWTLTDRRLSYDASTLSDYIDGGAETYLDYGFAQVVSQEYSSGTESVVCSVYEMRDPEAAFGLFSLQRSPQKRRLEIGDGGLRAEAQLTFWQARYYVTVESGSPSGAAERALETFVRAISARIGIRSGPPPVMSQLPRQYLRPSTDRLLKGRSAADALAGVGGEPGVPLVDAGTIVLSGDYETPAGTCRLLVILAPNAGAVDHVRALPGRLFTAAAGYVPAAVSGRGLRDANAWMRRGRAFAAQPIDRGVRLAVDATRLEAALAALSREDARR